MRVVYALRFTIIFFSVPDVRSNPIFFLGGLLYCDGVGGVFYIRVPECMFKSKTAHWLTPVQEKNRVIKHLGWCDGDSP